MLGNRLFRQADLLTASLLFVCDWEERSVSALLQICGALIEASGLLLIALGVAETREAFPGTGPGTLKKTWEGFLRRLPWYKPATRTVQMNSIGSAEAFGQVTLKRGFNWENKDLDERVERLQEIAQEHEDQIAQLSTDLGSELSNVKASVQALRGELEEMKKHTERLVAQTVTSGLDREVYGLMAFIVGLTLQTWGGLLG